MVASLKANPQKTIYLFIF